MIETLLVVTCGLVVVLGFQVQGLKGDLRIIRAEIAKGGRLTSDEEETALSGQPPLKKA